MTLEEVATVLDIAQEKMEPPAYIGDKKIWRKEQKRIGDEVLTSNLSHSPCNTWRSRKNSGSTSLPPIASFPSASSKARSWRSKTQRT